MKRLTRLAAITLVLVAVLAMLAACNASTPAQPSCYEVDHPKAKRPTGPKVKAPAPRVPAKRR